jgi:hypothetical protein
MANAIVTEFDKAKAWFAKVWKKLPAWNVTAGVALNVTAGVLEGLLAAFDPTAAVLIDPIVQKIQTDFGTVASLVASANFTNVPTFIAAIKADLPTLLTVGQVTDTATVEKVTADTDTVIAELDAILAAIPAAA